MENKLELKYLAPYLPYGLKGKWHPEDITPHIYEMISLSDGQINQILSFTCCSPILRPLADLTKTIFQFEYGEPTTLEDWINGNCDLGALRWVLKDKAKEQRQERIMDLPYFVAEYLFQYHFDLFGLIEKGLAIDINTIEDGKETS